MGGFSSSNPLANLVGKAVGGLVAGVVDQLGKQLESAAQESQAVYVKASSAVKRSEKAQKLLGGVVECGPVTSQSMSSVNINGRASSSINLSFSVYSASGRMAQARVSAADGGSSAMDIKLFLQGGTVVKITEDGFSSGSVGGRRGSIGGGPGEVIDAEFKDIPSGRK